eukprot:TRINITY_DN3262_c0_g2_i1.p2 TRINITY_DN3262_c0_g2~~TRINITY_DN3262_c0_g2_i1.p2  ORF type:complete len:137 (-),score=29.61 TRINITY_DN3262_c0_g2_i1:78-488(-)
MPTYQTKEEATDAFKALLAEKKISEDDHWNTTLSKIISDPRYRALKTLSERKKVFKQYKEEIGEKILNGRYEKRAKDKKLRSDFNAMLEECSEIKCGMGYHNILPTSRMTIALRPSKTRSCVRNCATVSSRTWRTE